MERAAVFEGSVLLTARAMRTSLTCVVSLFLFLCAWHWRVVGELPLPACAALALLLALYLLYGHLFATASARLLRNTAAISALGGASAMQEARRDDILRFMRLRDTAQLQQFTASRGIVWFLAYPGPVLAWPAEISEEPAYACGGYRLYRFPNAAQAAFNP